MSYTDSSHDHVDTINLGNAPTHSNDEALTRLETSQSQISPPDSLLREVIFVAVVCMAQLITQAGLCISIAPVYIIGHSFGTTNPANLSWFAAAYSLSVGTFILVAG
jgi:hypothetical protein